MTGLKHVKSQVTADLQHVKSQAMTGLPTRQITQKDGEKSIMKELMTPNNKFSIIDLATVHAR